MKKNTKLSLLTMGMAIPTIATLVSCGKSTRFEQQNDDKLIFAHSFGSTGAQIKALEKVVEKWNEYVKAQRAAGKGKKEGFIPMELRQINGGYSGLTNELNTKLNAKDKTTFWNLVFNYPVATSTLKKYDMHLSFSTKDDQDLSKAKMEEVFAPKFLEFNQRIASLDKNEVWAIPTNRSSQVTTINTPVMAYILKKAKADGATIKTEDAAFFTDIERKGLKDATSVAKIWKGEIEGGYVSSENGLKGFKFKKSIFETYDGLFDLASRIKVAFPKAFGKDSLKDAKNVFGIDALANVVYTMALSEVNGDYSKFLFGLNEKNTAIDYNSLLNGTDKEKVKIFKEIFEVIRKAIKEKSIFIKDVSDYASNYLKNHQMAFALSSTAGFKNNIVDKQAYRISLSGTDKKDTTINLGNYDFFIYNVSAKEKSEGKLARIIDSSKASDVLAKRKYNFIYSKAKAEQIINGYDEEISALDAQIKAANDADKPALETKKSKVAKTKSDFIKYNKFASDDIVKGLEKITKGATVPTVDVDDKNVLSQEPGEVLGVFTTSDSFKDHYKNYPDTFIYGDGENTFALKYSKDKKAFENEKYGMFLLKVETGKANIATASIQETLQKEELVSLIHPLKWKETNTKKVVTSQGPSLMAIHSNEDEDKATREFAKWFLNNKTNFTDKKEADAKEEDKQTPVEYFAIEASYTVPSKAYLANADKSEFMKKQNAFNKIAIERFKKVSDDTTGEYVIFEDPTDALADSFRKTLEKTFSTWNKGDTADKNYEEFMKEFKTGLSSPFRRK